MYGTYVLRTYLVVPHGTRVPRVPWYYNVMSQLSDGTIYWYVPVVRTMVRTYVRYLVRFRVHMYVHVYVPTVHVYHGTLYGMRVHTYVGSGVRAVARV